MNRPRETRNLFPQVPSVYSSRRGGSRIAFQRPPFHAAPFYPFMGQSGAVFRLRTLFAPSLLLIWGGLMLGGCSLPHPTPPAIPLSAQQRAQETARYQSLGKALGKIDGQTIKGWVNRWNAPNGAAGQVAPRAVRIDVEALATRHPAWLLANALENGAIAPDSPQIARVLAVAPSNSSFLADDLTAPSATLPAKTLAESGDGAATQTRQNAALDRFFAAAAARDALRGKDEAFLSRRALEDSIAVARRGAVAELDLSLVPPDVALELTNLRLQLLRSLGRTPEQRRATRAEITAIEERYNEIWRQQTAIQNAKLQEATRDLPARQREAGLKKIETQKEEDAEKRQNARVTVQSELKGRLATDTHTRSSDLRLVLPPAPSLDSKNIAGTQFFETRSGDLPSLPPTKTESGSNEPVARKIRQGSPVLAQLRAKARHDARIWASLVAAQLGSRWDNAPQNPDRTGAAIAILFPAPHQKSLF